jgi:hypothetical protein
VLVERVEGITTAKEWQRAYREINEFERMLVESGVHLVKLFLHYPGQAGAPVPWRIRRDHEEPGSGLFGDMHGMIVEDQLDRRVGRRGGVEKRELDLACRLGSRLTTDLNFAVSVSASAIQSPAATLP